MRHSLQGTENILDEKHFRNIYIYYNLYPRAEWLGVPSSAMTAVNFVNSVPPTDEIKNKYNQSAFYSFYDIIIKIMMMMLHRKLLKLNFQLELFTV